MNESLLEEVRIQSGGDFSLATVNGSGGEFVLAAVSAACLFKVPSRYVQLAIVGPRGNPSSCWSMGFSDEWYMYQSPFFMDFYVNFELGFLNTFSHTYSNT